LLAERGNRADAAQWYIRAHEAGDPLALNNLGALRLESGDRAEAQVYLRAAAEAGDGTAMRNLGVFHMDDGREGEAFRWWHRSAKAGCASGMSSLAQFHYSRGHLIKAETWYRRAAELGDPIGMANLGALLLERDRYPEAAIHLVDAHRIGPSTTSRYMLGLLYDKWQQPAKAESWYRQASEEGYTDATVNLAVLHCKRGDRRTARGLFEAAALAGNTKGMLNHALELEKIGNFSDARCWMRRALAAGDSDAPKALASLAVRTIRNKYDAPPVHTD
jgi:TPR repeat protein